jgi:hypothetical protein
MADLDPDEVREALAFDPDTAADFRARWTRLMELAVWGDIKAAEVGALPRIRKRTLEYGEKLRSLFNDRSWIPQPREQVKSVLSAALDVRDRQQALGKELAGVTGGADHEALAAEAGALEEAVAALLDEREARWQGLLNQLYTGDADDEEATDTE